MPSRLLPYWIRVRERNKPGSYWDLSNLKQSQASFSNHDSVAEILYNLCESYTTQTETDDDQRRTFTIEKLARDGEIVEAEIRTGEYGITADFYDIEEGKRIPNARDENHAEEFPFRMFYCTLASKPDTGLLILEIFQNRSVRSLLEERFENALVTEYGNAYLEIDPAMDDRVAEMLDSADRFIELTLQGREKLRAVDDYATDGGDVDGVEDGDKVRKEYVFKPERGESLRRRAINAVAEKEFELIGIEDENYEDAKVTIEDEGNEYTFSLWEDEVRMRMNIEEDDEDVETVGGKPTTDSVERKCRELANILSPSNEKDLDTDPLLGGE